MPDFPRYNSKSTLNTQPNAVVRNDTSEQLDIVNKATGQVSDITMKWSQAMDSMQETAIKSNIAVGLAQIKNEAELDPNINNEKLQIEKVKKLRQAAMGKGLQNKSLQQQLNFQLDTQEQLATLEINNIYAKKKIDFTRNTTMPNVIEGYHQIKQTSVYNSPQWQDADNKLKSDLEGWRQKGIINYEEKEKLYNQEQELGVKQDIANDNARHEGQSQVLKDLRDSKGRYAFLNSKQRLALIEDNQRRIFQNNQTFKRDIEDLQNTRNNNLIDKAVNREITIADIQAELAIPEEQGGIKRETLLRYQNGVLSGIKNDLNRMLQEKTPNKEPTKRAILVKQYNDLIDNFIDDKTDQWKAKEMLAQAWTDGIINTKEQQFLNNLKGNLKNIEWNRSTNPIVSAIKKVKDFSNMQANPNDENLARKIKTLVNGISSGQDPQVTADNIIRQDVINNNPEVTSYPKEGKRQYNPTLNKYRIIYPDGTIKYEEAK